MKFHNASTGTFRYERVKRCIDFHFASAPGSNRGRTSRHHVGGAGDVAHAATIATTS